MQAVAETIKNIKNLLNPHSINKILVVARNGVSTARINPRGLVKKYGGGEGFPEHWEMWLIKNT